MQRLRWLVWLLLALPGLARAEDPHLPPGVAPAVQAWALAHQASVTAHDDQIEVALPSVRLLVTPAPTDGQPRGGHLVGPVLVLSDPRDGLAAAAGLEQALREARLSAPSRGEPAPPGAPPEPWLMTVTWLLLALSLWALPWALARSPGALGLAHRARWGLLAAVPIALGLRAWLPHRLVMVHFGLLHVDQAARLDRLPRYGSATTLLDHAVFQLWPAHHTTVQGLHVVLGALTVLPLGVLTGRLVAEPLARTWAALATAWTAALLPLSVLDHGSESMLVPAFLWWTAAAALLPQALAERRWPDLLAATVLLALCGLSRPDCLLLALPTAVGLALAVVRPSWSVLIGLGAGVLLACLPGLAWLQARAGEDLAAGNLPHWNDPGWFMDRFVHGWVVLDWSVFPLSAACLPLLAVLWPPVRRGVLALALVSVLWALPMLLDFNASSALRLHAPSALLWLAAALLTLAGLRAAPLANTWHPALRRLVAGLALSVLAADATGTVGEVFAPQNSDADLPLYDEVARLSHDRLPTTFVARGYADAPGGGIHLFQPDYLLEPGDRWLSVRDWQRRPRAPGPVYYVQGVRCYAGLLEQRSGFTEHLHPACSTLCRRGDCTEVWQRRVVNRGERGFDWYPTRQALSHLRIGVWRLR
jgi:hypothetical protein